MRRDILAVIGLLGILALVVGMGVVVPTFNIGMPHGYDGIVATAHSVEHGYDVVESVSNPYYQGIDPDGFPTGLRATCTSPQYVGHVDEEPIVTFEKVTVDGVDKNETTTIKVSRVNFEMNINVETYGWGVQPINDVSFWFELQNNPFSVFTGADDVAIAVIKVSTTSLPVIDQKGEDIDFFPKAGGQQIALYTMDGARLPDVPSWLEKDYVVENIARLQNVKFAIDIFEADPIWEYVFPFGSRRIDCMVTFTLSIDVMLYGEWKVLKPWEEYTPPDPDLTWWESLMLWIDSAMPDTLSFIMLIVWVIVGFVATIVIFRFVPGIKLKLVATVIVWAIIIMIFGIDALTTWLAGVD